uniref:NADH-ubiquinone oxidoreductase chain 4 n=1 Tax=Myosotella myosotis TaxID=252580 RepID=B3DFF6_9EUPU|nr:NADH dehydrogenase subunit 4 [Myosotella myosotis]ACE62843.1 NADH dehydrogenase subunit 4 [Myosotella myosotis]
MYLYLLTFIVCALVPLPSAVVGVSFLVLVTVGGLHHNFQEGLAGVLLLGDLGGVMVLLTASLALLSILSSWEEPGQAPIILILSIFLFLAFSASSVIWFYLFFEASLIPTLFLIVRWGYQPERVQAGTYMILYTVTASLPLLVLLVGHVLFSGSDQFSFLSALPTTQLSGVSWLFLFAAFLVKMPIYGGHLWLPKAHVEAPLAGSMLLAGILLKLGGFGLYQMVKILDVSHSAFSVIFGMCMWGGLLSSLICLRQVDVKSYVAYSSVAHMSIVIAGVLSGSAAGLASSSVVMFAHGFSSPALFYLAAMTYKKAGTRSLVYMGGYLSAYPILALFWFLFCSVNMAAPPTLNLLGEMMVMPALWSFHFLFLVVGGLLVFFSAAYNMLLYVSVSHGALADYASPACQLRSAELLSLFLHLVPLLFVLKVSLISSLLA